MFQRLQALQNIILLDDQEAIAELPKTRRSHGMFEAKEAVITTETQTLHGTDQMEETKLLATENSSKAERRSHNMGLVDKETIADNIVQPEEMTSKSQRRHSQSVIKYIILDKKL